MVINLKILGAADDQIAVVANNIQEIMVVSYKGKYRLQVVLVSGRLYFLVDDNGVYDYDTEADALVAKGLVDAEIEEALEAGGGAVDMNAMAYFNYAGNIYGAKYNLLASAWESSLLVDPLEISGVSTSGNPRGKAQYPNGETEGVIIPQGVTIIGNHAFSGWSSNNHPLIIPNSVTSIGQAAFSGWSSNNQPLVIPDSVTNISASAFQSWTSNTHPLVIPDSVTSIQNYAFFYWTNVPYIEMKSVIPPTLAHIAAFGNQNDAPIYVPDGSVNDYKTATNWIDLASRIFGISTKP